MPIRGFIKVLRRFQLGKLSKNEDQLINRWYCIIHKRPIEKNLKEEIKERMWMKINQTLVTNQSNEDIKTTTTPFKDWTHYFSAAVAVVLVLVVSSYLLMNNNGKYDVLTKVDIHDSRNWQEVVNDLKTTKEIVLSDGSKVVLEPNSKLSFPINFEFDQRVVKLIGNGFFEIAKDAKRPFLVYSGTILTRVLGTSFTIKQVSEKNGIEVAVLTGKVIVEKNNLSEESNIEKVILTANKRVTFFENSDHYISGLVDQPIMIKSDEEILDPRRFNFDETKLQDVLNQLESAYGIEIALSNDKMLDCPITADLSTDDLYEKIEIIGAILNANYQITGTTILLVGNGCSKP